jgi:hypothetical protein
MVGATGTLIPPVGCGAPCAGSAAAAGAGTTVGSAGAVGGAAGPLVGRTVGSPISCCSSNVGSARGANVGGMGTDVADGKGGITAVAAGAAAAGGGAAGSDRAALGGGGAGGRAAVVGGGADVGLRGVAVGAGGASAGAPPDGGPLRSGVGRGVRVGTTVAVGGMAVGERMPPISRTSVSPPPVRGVAVGGRWSARATPPEAESSKTTLTTSHTVRPMVAIANQACGMVRSPT